MKRILILAALAFSLSGCFVIVPDRPTTTVRPTPTPTTPVFTNTNPRPVVTNIIQDFQPDRGTGATYRIGDRVFFRLTSARAGFVTLVIYNEGVWQPDEIQSIPVRVGLNLIPNSNELQAAEPIGTSRIRAFFTPQASAGTSFSGGTGQVYIEDASNSFLNRYPAEARDLKDTYLFVTR